MDKTYTTLFLISLFITLFVETPFVIILVKFFKENITLPRVIGISFLATSLTIPYLWFVFNSYFDYKTMAILGESFVFIVEALIYWKLLPIKLSKAIIISIIANSASIIIGLLI